MPADIGKFDDRPTHGEGVTFTHKRPDLPGEASRTFKGRIEGGQQVWDIQAPESTSGGGGSGSGGVVLKKFGNATSVDLIQVPGDEVWIFFDFGSPGPGSNFTVAPNKYTTQFLQSGAYLVPYDPKEPEDWTSYDDGPTTVVKMTGYEYYPGAGLIAWRTATGVHIANRENNWTKSYHQIDTYTDKISIFHYSPGGGSSTGAGEFLGRVDFNSGGSGNNWTHTHINNPGHSLPDPADLIMPTAHNNFPQAGSPLEFKNLTNNTYVIENVGYHYVVSMNGPGETGYIDAVILPPNTRVGVHDGTYQGMWSSNYSTTSVPPHSWYIYKGGGKEHSIDFIKTFYSDLRDGQYGWNESNYNEVSSLPEGPDGIYIEGVAI